MPAQQVVAALDIVESNVSREICGPRHRLGRTRSPDGQQFEVGSDRTAQRCCLRLTWDVTQHWEVSLVPVYFLRRNSHLDRVVASNAAVPPTEPTNLAT